jgi:hypothetical protein
MPVSHNSQAGYDVTVYVSTSRLPVGPNLSRTRLFFVAERRRDKPIALPGRYDPDGIQPWVELTPVFPRILSTALRYVVLEKAMNNCRTRCNVRAEER